MEALVSPRWVLARMYEPDLVIVDCRFKSGEPEAGRLAYETAHLPGAVYLDPERDLSAPDGDGRDGLPRPEELALTLGRAGIGNAVRVVVYDDSDGRSAARLWALLRWLGHDLVTVMDGGFAAWIAGGFPVNDARRIVVPASFTPSVRSDLLADAEIGRALGLPGILPVESSDTSFASRGNPRTD